jgi:hypothetical protein
MANMDTSGVLDLFAAPGSAAAAAGATGSGSGAAGGAQTGGPADGGAASAAAAAGGGGAGGGALKQLLSAVGELHDDQSQYEGLSVAAFASKLQPPQGG